jgi:TPR repeat protein
VHQGHSLSDLNDFCLQLSRLCTKSSCGGFIMSFNPVNSLGVCSFPSEPPPQAIGSSAEDWFQQGLAFASGDGCDQSWDIAVESFRKAAESNHPRAICNLGVCYLNGTGVEQDAEEAAKCLGRAADLNCVEAMVLLGQCFLEGRGVTTNPQMAARWFLIASNLGYVKATYQLACCYVRGSGVPQDVGECERLLRRAVEAGDAAAQYTLSISILSGAIPGIRDEGETLLRRAAEGGLPEAMLALGVRYVNPDVNPYVNIDEAKKWFQKAAFAGNADAIGFMGLFLLNEPGCLDVKKSVAAMQHGVDFGNGRIRALEEQLRRFRVVD